MSSNIARCFGPIIVSIIVGILCSAPPVKSTVELVQMITRHGDRAPVYSFPTDPWKQKWEKIQGELTAIGKQQAFTVGQFLRERYVGTLLKDPYQAGEVYVRSTDINRTILTAYNMLAGLFPPSTCKPWSRSDPWTMIPVHTVPRQLDWLLWIPTNDVASCPKHNDLSTQMKQTLVPYYSDMKERNKNFIEFIARKSGQEIVDIRQLDIITDVLNVEIAHDLSVPDWVNSTVLEKLRERLNKYYLETYLNSVGQRRLRSGPVIKTMLDNIENRISEKVTDTKLYIYSSHDITVSGVLLALGVHNGLNPPYATALIMELHKIESEYYVQMLYRNDTLHEPYVLNLPNCASPCPLDHFKDNVKDVTPIDVLKECQVTSGLITTIGAP